MDFTSRPSMVLLSGASTWRSGLASGRPGCLVARAHELEVGLELWPVALRTRCFLDKHLVAAGVLEGVRLELGLLILGRDAGKTDEHGASSCQSVAKTPFLVYRSAGGASAM
jgi:hypothetical protein